MELGAFFPVIFILLVWIFFLIPIFAEKIIKVLGFKAIIFFAVFFSIFIYFQNKIDELKIISDSPFSNSGDLINLKSNIFYSKVAFWVSLSFVVLMIFNLMKSLIKGLSKFDESEESSDSE
jgi:hypothetical protein